MINDDKSFVQLVNNIANGSAESRDSVLLALGYLREADNWNRLKNSMYGKFLREFPEHTPVPDYGLRVFYRSQIMARGLT